MDIRFKNLTKNKNLICALAALLVVVIYLLIDGMGMFANSYRFIQGSDAYDNLASVDYREVEDGAGIIGEMLEQHFTRTALLALVLFAIVFVALRFHISFRNSEKTGYRKYLPYIRAFLGFVAFYYCLTIGTVFNHELFTNFYSFGHWLSFFRIVGAFTIFGILIIDWTVFIPAVKSFPDSHPWVYKCVFVLFIALCSCMVLEFQLGSKMNMKTNMLPYNILYWIIIQLLVDVISRNMKAGAFVSLGTAYLIGLINDVVYQFRGNYVMYGDLTVVRTALEVAGNYKYKFGTWFFIALAILIAATVVTIMLRFPKRGKAGLKEILIRAAVAVSLLAAVAITFSNGLLYKRIFGVYWDYNESVRYNGYIPYFLSNMNSIATVTLDGYDPAIADAALSQASEQQDQISSPNIIIIQNEAFSDLAVAYDIETNRDYIPFVRSLTENTRKGYLNMSITGGPTANTEFEILLRSTLNFIPIGSVPYTQYINDDLPSAVQVLRNQPEPYHTVAYHPYYSSGYRRTEVYDHFGFDQIVFENDYREDFSDSDIVRDFLSDSADYRRVEQLYEEYRSTSDAPWFCFNVTIQNHGGYTQDYEPDEDDRIEVTNFEATDSINEYLSLIKVSDDAFRELIEYFSNCDEPTVIAMYGDHQPSFDNEAVDILSEHALSDGMNEYYVPYIIWANFDIEEADDARLNTLSTNYFASTVFEVAGIELTDYDRYLLGLHEQVPAITALGVWDNDGNYYESVAESPFAEEMSELQTVQYNLIFDDEGRLTGHYE